MNYRRTRISNGRLIVSNDCQRPNDLCHRIPQIEPQFRFNPLLHYQTFQRPYSLPSTTTFMNSSVRLLEWMPRIAPVSTHIPPISLVYSSPVIIDVPSDSMPLDLTMSRHSFYTPQHALCEAAIDMSVMASRGRPPMQRGENLPSVQRSLTSDVMLEILPSGGSEEFAPSGKGKKSKGSKCGGNARPGRKRGSKNQQKMQKQQTAKLTTVAGSCLSPTRTMEAVEGLLMLPESSSPSSTAVSGPGEASTSKRLKTPRKSRKPMNYRPIDYLAQSINSEESSAAAAAALPSEFAIDRIYGRAATELEGNAISSGTAVTFESTLSQFCRLLESSCCSTLTGSALMQNSQPFASCITVTATETQTSPARSNIRPLASLRVERLPPSLESKATETLVSTAENGCQTDDDFGAICLDRILNTSLSSTWTTKETKVNRASDVHFPFPANVTFNGEVESLSSLDLPQMKDLIHRLKRRVEMLEQATGDASSAEHLLPLDYFGSEPLFNSTAVVTSRESEISPHEMSESEESLHLRLSESDDFVDLEQHDSPDSDHLPSDIDPAPVVTESGEKSCDFALSGKISDLKRQLKAIENKFVSVETCDEERNSDDAFQGDLDSVGHETDGSIPMTSCHASEKQNLGVTSSASHSAEGIVCIDEKSDAGMITPLETNDYEFQRSATVTQQNSELSTVMDQMASLDIAKGYVLSNYQSKLQLEAISPPSSVISLHDDETGDMDFNLENDNAIIAHENENNKVLEGISDITDGRSGQSNCREIVVISASTPVAENIIFSDSILSRINCVNDNIHIGTIVSAECNTSGSISDGASVGSGLRVDVVDTSTDIVICDVGDIDDVAPDRVFQTDTDVLDTVKEIDRSHEMQVEVDDMDDAQDESANDETEQSDLVERDKPTDELLSLYANTSSSSSSENELTSRYIQSVALLSDNLESSIDVTETSQSADATCHTYDDDNDCLTVETFSEEVVIDANIPQLLNEGHQKEKVVSDLSSGAYGTLLDARVVIKRLNLDAILEKGRDYKPVVAKWLHKPRRPRRRCRKTKSKGKHMPRLLHCDHSYVQSTLDDCSRILDSSEVPEHILQNVEVVAVQQSDDLSTSVEPYDVRPHVVEPVTTFPLSFDSGLSGEHVDYSGTAVSSSSDVEQGPWLHLDDSTVQDNSLDDVDTEVETNFTSNNEVISKEDQEHECTDSFSAKCSESSVAMVVTNGVAVSVDDGCQAPQHEPSVIDDRSDATFGNSDKSLLDILETDAATVENNDHIGSSGVFVCSDQPRTSNVPRVLDREINRVVKKLRTIGQEVKNLSGTRESAACDGPQETATRFPSYPEDKKASKARFRGLPIQSLPHGSSDIRLHQRTDGECVSAEDLPNVAGPDLSDGKEIALEHDSEVKRDGSGVVLLSGSGNSGCQERTEEMPNASSDIDNSAEQQKPLAANADSDWPNEENVEADTVSGNTLAADDSNTSYRTNMNLSGHVNDSINMGIVASPNVPRKCGRKPKARQSCSVSNDDCRDIALSHGAGKAFVEHEDRGGVMASQSIQRKRRGRLRSSHFFSSDDESSTRTEKKTKYDTLQAVETVKTNQKHRISKHNRNLFKDISSSNIVNEEQSSSSVCFDFPLRNSEAEHNSGSKRPMGCRMGRPPKHQLNPNNSSNLGSEFGSQSKKQIRNKKKSWRLGDQDTKQQQYSQGKRSTNGSKTSEINCRKYKTKNVQGQCANNRKPLALNTSGDEDQKYTRQEIPLLKTMNLTREVVITKMHVNVCRGKLAMIVDVITRTVSGAPSGSRLAQCLFCEFLAPIKDIGEHLDDCHSELVLVISKVRASQESSICYFCRHCQFVTIDHTVMWIHFEISHNIRGILTSENHIYSDFSGDEPEVQPLSLDLLVHFDRVYMCPECGNLTENRKAMISHVVRCHTMENYCNGNFVKSIALTRPRNLSKQPTYHSLVMDDAFSVYRKPCYICVFCQFVVFEARLALSHFICVHMKKKLLMVCMKDSCGQRFIKERHFYEHVKQSHNGLDLGAHFDCSVTLLEDSALSGEIAEVVLPPVRNGSRQPTSPSHS